MKRQTISANPNPVTDVFCRAARVTIISEPAMCSLKSVRTQIHPRVGRRGDWFGSFQLAALLSLHDDVKVAGTASVGALFRTEDLLYWRKVAPFDADDAVELRMRLLYPNLADMKLSHIAYVGEDDTTSGKAVHAFTAEGRRFGAPLRVVTVKGDETTSLRPALMQFIDAVKNADFPQRGYAAASDPASAEP